jgi:hypothetical protein
MSASQEKAGSGGRYVRQAVRKPPEGMVMLRPDGNNMIEWLNTNGIKLETEHGDIADFVRGDDYPVRAMLTAEELAQQFPGLSATQRNSISVKDAEAYMAQDRKDKKAKHAIYSQLEACVSLEGFDKVSRMTGFAATHANGRDPRALLALIIAEHTLKTDNVSDMEARYNAERRYEKIRMVPEQSLTEFTKAFRAVVKNMTTLQVNPVPSVEKQVHHFLMRLDNRRFASYQTSVVNAMRKGEANAMPATIDDLVEAARKHVPIGGSGGNFASKAATNPMVFTAKSAQEEQSCGRCGGKRHTAVDCMTSAEKVKAYKLRAKAQAENATATSAHVHATSTRQVEEDGGYDDEDNETEKMFGYGYSLGAHDRNEGDAADMILTDKHVCIDCLANRNFVCNKELLTDMRKVNMEVKGVHGMQMLDSIGEIPCFGSAVYAPKADMNGLALCEVESRHAVTYEQGVAFYVNIDDKYELVFDFNAELGCYACLFDGGVINKLRELDARFNYTMITTTQDNEANYTSREVKGAKQARDLMRRLHYPSDSALIRTLTKGAMLECPVTGKDVVTATELYGKDVASLKAKTKDKGPVGDYRVLVPKMMRK